MTGYADCERQRPLNEQGRRDARDIGRAIRELQLPVASASPARIAAPSSTAGSCSAR